MNQLISVKQLPIIEEHLRSLGAEIDRKTAEATSLVCTEDTVKEVKKVRADLNKQFGEVEEQRKAAKAAVLEPYNAFEALYREHVSSKFKTADDNLKRKISEVEDGLKTEKKNAVRTYFDEYAVSMHIDWLKFLDAGLNVTLSASEKSLKEKAKAYIDGVCEDLKLIETQEHRDEVLVEYKLYRNVTKAVTVVAERHKALERESAAKAEKEARSQAEKEAVKAVEAVAPPESFSPPVKAEPPKREPPKQENDPVLSLAFTVVAPKSKLVTLKKFLDDGGYKYE